MHCFQGEGSGRRVFQVHGKSSQHTALPRHYCSCQAHHYEVVCKSEAPYVSLAFPDPLCAGQSGCLDGLTIGAHCTTPTLGASQVNLPLLCMWHTSHCLPHHARHANSTTPLLVNSSHMQCKHQLAARLAWILKSCPVTPVDDAMIANMLLEA